MDLKGRHYTWFQNRDCEYFPCHDDVREEEFNCLFCYCPLYRSKDCGWRPGRSWPPSGRGAWARRAASPGSPRRTWRR